MLTQLQQRLSNLYRADPGHDVQDFLITDRRLAIALGQDALLPGTEESLLVQEDDDGVALSVYLDKCLLERLSDDSVFGDLCPEQLDDLCKVLEGISHFNYLAWRALQDRTVTLLELEMQAEVDKFVATFLLLQEQRNQSWVEHLHALLFDNIRFRDDLDTEQRQRYEDANHYAGIYCHLLRNRLTSDDRSGVRELRHFYRLDQGEKISHIRSAVLSSA